MSSNTITCTTASSQKPRKVTWFSLATKQRARGHCEVEGRLIFTVFYFVTKLKISSLFLCCLDSLMWFPMGLEASVGMIYISVYLRSHSWPWSCLVKTIEAIAAAEDEDESDLPPSCLRYLKGWKWEELILERRRGIYFVAVPHCACEAQNRSSSSKCLIVNRR